MSGNRKKHRMYIKGVCGKEETTANLQDLLIFHLKGIAVLAKQGKAAGVDVYTHGEMLPAFVSPAVLNVLVENFDIKPTGDAEENIAAMMAGKQSGPSLPDVYVSVMFSTAPAQKAAVGNTTPLHQEIFESINNPVRKEMIHLKGATHEIHRPAEK